MKPFLDRSGPVPLGGAETSACLHEAKVRDHVGLWGTRRHGAQGMHGEVRQNAMVSNLRRSNTEMANLSPLKIKMSVL